MLKEKLHIVFFTLFLSCLSIFGQTKKELEQQRIKLKKEIQQVNSLLFTEQKKEKNALENLKDINQKIQVRLKLINTINLEAKLLSNEIQKNQKELDKLEKELSDLKKDYGDMIFKSYKSKSQQSRAMFLLSSQNFYQAYKRLEYLKQYAAFRKKQAEAIVAQTKVVEKLNDSLIKQKQIKDTLILAEKEQKNIIELDRKRQEKLISTIKKKESKYKRDLRKKISEEKKVAAKIDEIIRDEIAKANRNVKNKPKSSKKNEFILSPEAKALAAKFELNKGKLPWPVKEGLITRKFGRQPHPTFPGITINGTGLHITTKSGNNAEAIFSGQVMNILISPEGRKNVLIRHGNYISSYNNLSKLYVKKGDAIVVGQNIGKIFTNKVSGKTNLIFAIYKNTVPLNPASWILKR
ncbi:peptidoglycan DD-metalloendopeptidase family protein [Polaribacter batillariae]|uniref:Peptidoglycan DD-metalloendopeptidase family protein n=1 Tax=Polaribacter batillariae TaxID=2808900 RepID=A0ABX7SQ07_9FLAO|nr:peptidoglycan DD-metalloendopeptidase family protein [Polaribacter batillariae]QTD36310.1 peptidoglycan DD-metalloendopeptidase family protein [Polaribacter batillariae]